MSPESANLPDRSAIWQWAVASRRALLGWGLAILGAVALFLGWYGVSGNSLTAKQLPYVVSGGLTGVALVVLAAAVLATEDMRRQLTRVTEMARKIETLYDLLVDVSPTTDDVIPVENGEVEAKAALVAVAGGTSYHRPTCGLVVGKETAKRIGPSRIAERGLHPCRVCEPAPVAAG